jgi:hypothetical protein
MHVSEEIPCFCGTSVWKKRLVVKYDKGCTTKRCRRPNDWEFGWCPSRMFVPSSTFKRNDVIYMKWESLGPKLLKRYRRKGKAA